MGRGAVSSWGGPIYKFGCRMKPLQGLSCCLGYRVPVGGCCRRALCQEQRVEKTSLTCRSLPWMVYDPLSGTPVGPRDGRPMTGWLVSWVSSRPHSHDSVSQCDRLHRVGRRADKNALRQGRGLIINGKGDKKCNLHPSLLLVQVSCLLWP